MKIVSWNLNGLLSKIEHRQFGPIAQRDPDLVCLQETRTKQTPEVLAGYHHFYNPCERDGFSGTLLLSKWEPLDVTYGFGDSTLDREGRIIVAEYPEFYLIDVYVPNSQRNLQREDYRIRWDRAFGNLMADLAREKPVIAAGDFNVARLDIDIYEENKHHGEGREGFASDERSDLESLLQAGFVDAFRHLYPDEENAFTWWSYRKDRRSVNRGWRLDYFIISEDLRFYLKDVRHLTDIAGSDHCPIEMEILL